MSFYGDAYLELGRTVGPPSRRLELPARLLETHQHVIGPPGVGKTRFLAAQFREILNETSANVVVIDPKSDLAELTTAIAIEQGHREKLVLVDFRDFLSRGIVAGFDPLAPHERLSPSLQVSAACAATRAAWGQQVFDQTPQLLRYLFVAYSAARFLGAGLEGAFRILQVESDLRREAITAVPHAFVRQELATLDALPPARRHEVTASATARLGPFLADPLVARMFAERDQRLDFDDILFGSRRRICIVNLATDQALRADAVKLVGRLLINHLLSVRQSRGVHAGRPTVLFVDEVGFLVTEDLVQALDWGRAFGLHLVCAHQRLGQLRKEDVDLEDALLACAQTKVIFGGCLTRDLERLAEETSLEEYDPYKVKDEIRRLELEPVEERRQSYTVTRSRGESIAVGKSASGTEGASEAENFGVSRSRGRSVSTQSSRGATATLSASDTDSQSATVSRGETRSASETRSRGVTHSQSETDSASRTESSSETDSASETQSSSETDSVSNTDSWGDTDSITETDSESQVSSASETNSEASSWSQVTALSQGMSSMESSAGSSGEAITTGIDGDVDSIARSTGAMAGVAQGLFSSSSEAFGISGSRGHAAARGYATAHGHAAARGRATTRGGATTQGHASSRGQAFTQGHATTRGEALTYGQATTRGVAVTDGVATTRGAATSDGHATTLGRATTRGRSDATSVTESFGLDLSESEGENEGRTRTKSSAVSRGMSSEIGAQRGESVSVQDAPFTAYLKRMVVASREFESREEFLTVRQIELKRQRPRHFAIKVPGKPVVFAKSLDVDPLVGRGAIERVKDQVYSLPFYCPIEKEEPVLLLPSPQPRRLRAAARRVVRRDF